MNHQSKNALIGAKASSRRLRKRWRKQPEEMKAVQKEGATKGARAKAMEYHLISPSGKHFTGTNLSDFARSIAAEMDTTESNAISRLSALNPTRKHAVPSWKGWRRLQ